MYVLLWLCAHCVFYASANPSVYQRPSLDITTGDEVCFVCHWKRFCYQCCKIPVLRFPHGYFFLALLPSTTSLAPSEKQQHLISDIWQHCINAENAPALLWFKLISFFSRINKYRSKSNCLYKYCQLTIFFSKNFSAFVVNVYIILW